VAAPNQATSSAVGPAGAGAARSAGAGAARSAGAGAARSAVPFRSLQSGDRLLLPPDWQVVSDRSAGPSGPAADVFEHPAGPVRLSIWTMPCNLLALPPVPRDQQAFAVPLPDGRPVPFVAYPLSAAGRVCLEGRWLQAGRRWLLDLQLPAGEAARAGELLRPLWSSLQVEA
jgi:hypothetical protein